MTYKFYQRLKQPELYRYSDAILKHMPKDALETFENTLLYSRKKVKLATNQDRQLHSDNSGANRTDSNLTERITKFADVIIKKNGYRFLIIFLSHIRIVNHAIKIDTKITRTLETHLRKLFESNKLVTVNLSTCSINVI